MQAPEVHAGKYDVKSEVYAYGVVVWEMLSGQVPFKGMSASVIRAAVKKGERPGVGSVGKLYREMLTACWHACLQYSSLENILQNDHLQRKTGVAVLTRLLHVYCCA